MYRELQWLGRYFPFSLIDSKEDGERSSKRLLKSLLDDNHITSLFSILIRNLDCVIQDITSFLQADSNDSTSYSLDREYLKLFVNSHMELANNCFLILGRFLWSYSHGCID